MIVSADALTVEIEKTAGGRFKVPLNTLSEDDRLFCEEWRVANPAIKLTVKADAVTAAGSRQTKNAVEGGSSSSTISRTRVVEEAYRISISNWSRGSGNQSRRPHRRLCDCGGFF